MTATDLSSIQPFTCIPRSYLGMNTGKCVLTDEDILVAMKIYHDGSEGEPDPNGDNWITLGGVAATDVAWADFDTKWGRTLKERYPVAPYVHMIELLGHESPFDRVNGWTLEKKRKLISDCIVTLSQMSKTDFRWFRFSVNTSAIERLYEQRCYVPADPHAHIALGMLAVIVQPYVNSARDREKIFVFYDRGEKFYRPVKKAWLENRTKPGMVPASFNAWDLLENIEEADQAKTSPLQVADMVAWSHTRNIPTSGEREFSDLKGHLLKFVPSSTVDVTQTLLEQQSAILKDGLGIK